MPKEVYELIANEIMTSDNCDNTYDPSRYPKTVQPIMQLVRLQYLLQYYMQTFGTVVLYATPRIYISRVKQPNVSPLTPPLQQCRNPRRTRGNIVISALTATKTIFSSPLLVLISRAPWATITRFFQPPFLLRCFPSRFLP